MKDQIKKENILSILNNSYSKKSDNNHFFGRVKEISFLEKIYNNTKISGVGVGVYGIRRSGKTFTIKHFIKQKEEELIKNKENVMSFNFVGNLDLTEEENIENLILEIELKTNNFLSFNDFISNFSVKNKMSFSAVFLFLEEIIKKINKKEQTHFLIFFDEVAWFSKNNNFINHFSTFWNKFGSSTKNLMLFLASSSLSWMKSNVFLNSKGMFQRLIKLEIMPFSFQEILSFFRENGWQNSKIEVLKYYLIFGGFIKHYLENPDIDFSLDFKDNFDYFNSNEFKYYIEQEYEAIFRGVFSNNKQFQEIIFLLSKYKNLTISEMCDFLEQKLSIKKTENHIRKQVLELEKSGFLKSTNLNSIKKYYLNIPLIYFYQFWFKANPNEKIGETGLYYNWQGIMFEFFVLNNLEVILKENNCSLNQEVFLNFTLKNKDLLIEQKPEQIALQCDILLEKKTSDRSKNRRREFLIIENKFIKNNVSSEELFKLEQRKMLLKEYFTNYKNDKAQNNVIVKTLILSTKDNLKTFNILNLFN